MPSLILGITGKIRLPKEESCGTKKPKLDFVANSIATLWLFDSTGDVSAVALEALGEALVKTVEDAIEEVGDWLICFFFLSNSSRIFLC